LVDFKHTLLPFIVGAKQYTPLIRFKQAGHSKDCNLRLVENLAVNTRGYQGKFVIDPARKQYWQQQITQKSIFIATASNSLYKMYPPQLLKQLTDYLQDYSLVLVGADKDKQYYSALSSYPQVMNLAGKTSFADVSYLLSNFALAIVCVDSSILHLASYLDKPIVALFGPSSHQRYGPWSQHYILLPSKSNVGGEQRLRATRKISDIKPREIAQAVKKIIHEQK
jgi:ADP-heptose:LPS heptosyltransferase